MMQFCNSVEPYTTVHKTTCMLFQEIPIAADFSSNTISVFLDCLPWNINHDKLYTKWVIIKEISDVKNVDIYARN